MNTEKRRAFIINFIYYVIILGLVFLAFKYITPIIIPFIIGFCIAWALNKPINFLTEKSELKRRQIALIAVTLFYLTIGSVCVLAILKIFSGAVDLISQLPAFYTNQIEPIFQDIIYFVQQSEVELEPQVLAAVEELIIKAIESGSRMISNFSVSAVSWISSTAFSIPSMIINFFLMIISSFFFAMDFDVIIGFFVKQFGAKEAELVKEIYDYLVGTVFLCIRSYALIMTITCIELCIGLTLIGIDNALIISICISIFDILPVLGTGGIMIPWGLIVLVSGNIPLGLGLLGVYLAITMIRNVIEPKIVGAQLGLHPILTLVSMFIGLHFFGIIGLFGFPIILSLLRDLNEKEIIQLYKA